MAQTLQEHYNSIKSGKGNKAQFLRQAKEMFPQYFNQYSDFDTATNVLKSKQIISEAAGGVVGKGFSVYDWKKILGEEVKATEKETSKEVLDDQKNAYNNSDMKNADNVNFNEIMKGFFAEMYDEKNKEKTGDEIKAMVVKNLAKDCLYYTKNGNFSTMGVGYTTEAPGLGEPKAPKGKHKSSGYGELKESISQERYEEELANTVAKYVKDPDDIDKEMSNYYSKGYQGFSDALKANLSRDRDLDTLVQMMHDEETLRREQGLEENKETSDEKIELKEGIHDRDITSASHTNVRQLPGGFWDNIKYEDASKLFDYHERTGDLPAGLSPEGFDKIMKKFNISRMDDSDIPFKNMTEEQTLRSLIRNLIKEELK